jgi:hypothetical protein
MKLVVVFCAEGKKPSTIQAVKKLYPGEDTQIIWSATASNYGRNYYFSTINVNNKNVTVPIASSNSPNNFNKSLSRILGNKKVDLFIFEFCPFLHSLNHPRANRISNILKKYSKNNSRVITHANRRNWSTRLTYNRTLNINKSVNRNYNKPRQLIMRSRNAASRAARQNKRNSNSNSNNNNNFNNTASTNNSFWNRINKVNVFKFV